MSKGEFHSYISPSSSGKTELCPASTQRSWLVEQRSQFLIQWGKYKFPTVISHYVDDEGAAEKGTMFHDIQKRELEHHLFGKTKKFDFNTALYNAGATDHEVEIMNAILRDILRQANDADHVWVERRFENEGLNSGGPPDVAMATSSTVIIRDLKTGRLEVKPDNSQFKRYACGVMDYLGWDSGIEKIDLHVDAIYFESSVHSMTVDDLIEYRDQVFHEAIREGNSINPSAKPGEHCLYCKARLHCPEYRDHISDPQVTQLFNKEFTEITPNELEKMWSLVKQVTTLSDQIKKEMTVRLGAEMSDPDDFKKYKLKQGASYRRFKKEKEDSLLTFLRSKGYENTHNEKLKTVKQLLNDNEGLDEDDLSPYINSGNNRPSIVLK